MTDHPILFSAPMVRAILDGRKTQTRRVINPQPESRCDKALTATLPSDGICRFSWETALHPISYSRNDRRIKHRVGDRLWVRENHYLTDDGDNEYAVFAADEDAVAEHIGAIAANKHQFDLSNDWAKPHLKLRPSIHMPRWASRLTLIVSDVRIQRLQAINDADAIAEGCPGVSVNTGKGYTEIDTYPRAQFRTLWDSLNGKPRKPNGASLAWLDDPWVCATTFTVHQANIDQLGQPTG